MTETGHGSDVASIGTTATFEEDLSMKLPIIQGNIWERQLFAELKESIGDQFVELTSFDLNDTINQMNQGTPVIAQGYMTKMLGNVMWSGLADLLICDDYEFVYIDQKLSAVPKNSGDPSKYAVFDIKHSSKAKDSYRLQVASYHEVLIELGYAGGDLGLVLKGFALPTFDATEVLAELEAARAPLLETLNSHHPSEPFEIESMQWHCTKPATCSDIYCDYPEQCKQEFLAEDHLFQLPTKFPSHLISLKDAGYGTVESLLGLDPETEIPGLKQQFVHHYTRWAAIVYNEKFSGQPFFSQIGKPTEVGLPELSSGGLFFDIEWFNPVGNVEDLNFMWGLLIQMPTSRPFWEMTTIKKKKAFQEFIEFSVAKLESDPNMHIYHHHNPEPLRMKKFSERYDYLHREVELLLPTMVDLKQVGSKSIEPGSGSYLIKRTLLRGR